MCSFDINVQKRVFKSKSAAYESREEVIKRLHACGVVTPKGELTSQFKFIAKSQK